MLIDSHCHLHDREFFTEEQATEALAAAKQNGVEKIVCIGTDAEDSLNAREFAARHENVFWTYGVHPENAGRGLSESAHLGLRPAGPSPRAAGAHPRAAALRRPFDERIPATHPAENMLLERSSSSRLIAIGEVGLDYHYEGYDREAQIELLNQMLQLASDNDLPVSFHVREAFPDWFGVIANFPQIRGVVHSFTDSKKVLKRILETTDFYIGVNGLATYSTLPTPSLERILLETDAPFLAPVPYRGEQNQPAYIKNIAEWLSGKLEVDFDEIAAKTTENAEKLFKI